MMWVPTWCHLLDVFPTLRMQTTQQKWSRLIWFEFLGKIVVPAFVENETLLNYIKVLTLLGGLQFMHFATLRFFFFFSKISATCMTFQGFFLVCTCTITDKWPSPATNSRWLHACILVWMNQHNAQVERFCVEPKTCCTKVGWILSNREQSPFTCTETISMSVGVCCRGRMWSCSRYFVFKSYLKVFRHQIDCQGQKKAASTNHNHVLILQRVVNMVITYWEAMPVVSEAFLLEQITSQNSSMAWASWFKVKTAAEETFPTTLTPLQRICLMSVRGISRRL